MDDLVERVDALSVKPPKISKETYLLKWLRDVKRGVQPNEARGKSDTAQYASLMNVRKREECPYTDEEPELKEAWERFTREFPPVRHEVVYYLQWFGEKYRDTGDFDAACGDSGNYKFAALKNIVDKDLRFPAFQAYEEQLKSGWKYETTRCTEMTPHLHLLEFFEEYREHKDFKKARGVNNSARYNALVLIIKKADEECSELERELKALWQGHMTPQDYLEAFFEEYREHKDFKKARGVTNKTRYLALWKITKKADEECTELELELKALWQGHMTPQEHLEAFFEEYREHNDFKKARGVTNKPRYFALWKITKKPDEACTELELDLKALWQGNMTSQEHLEAFFEEYRVHEDFKKARGVTNKTRYKVLRLITKKADEACTEQELELKALWNRHS